MLLEKVLSSDQDTSAKYLMEKKRGWSKTYVLSLSDQDKSFISTRMHPVKVWDVSLCKKKSSTLFIKSTKEA